MSMNTDPVESGQVAYRKSSFHTLLPAGYRYTAGHFWLSDQGEGVWRVGFTKFAARMVGEMVDHSFQVASGTPVALGDTIGTLEGFKAMTDLFCVATGQFLGGNEALRDQPKLVTTHPYSDGWLYAVRGEPDPAAMDVAGYQTFLDRVIDRLREKQGDSA